MKNQLRVAFIGLSLTAAAKPDADVIVKAAEAIRAPDVSYETTVSIVDRIGKKEKSPRVYKTKVDPKYGALVEFKQPVSEHGKKMLMSEENMWIKFPNAANPVKVSARQKLTGNASNGDVVSISYTRNYDAKYVTEVEENGKKAAPTCTCCETRKARYLFEH